MCPKTAYLRTAIVLLILAFFLFFIFIALGAGLYAAYSDFKGMIIPNELSLIILAVFCAYAALINFSGNEFIVSVPSHIIGGVAMFVITFFAFMAKMMGGGDAKIMSAYAFWFGLKGIVAFVFYTALFGAVVGLVALYLKKNKPVQSPKDGSWIQRVQAGESAIPYGIPIFIGALLSFLKLGYFSAKYLKSLL